MIDISRKPEAFDVYYRLRLIDRFLTAAVRDSSDYDYNDRERIDSMFDLLQLASNQVHEVAVIASVLDGSACYNDYEELRPMTGAEDKGQHVIS